MNREMSIWTDIGGKKEKFIKLPEMCQISVDSVIPESLGSDNHRN